MEYERLNVEELRRAGVTICFGPDENPFDRYRIYNGNRSLQKRLTKSRIEKFKHFEATQSNIGDRCPVCLSDFEVGSQLVELGCDGRHLLCKECTYKWFSNHKTCPTCRHKFEN